MTLVMTLVSARLIMQCADFRRKYPKTGKWVDKTQKQAIIVRPGWQAVVSFAGIAEANWQYTDDWLAKVVLDLSWGATFTDLLARLKESENWLASVPKEHRCHSFVAAGFVGIRPIIGVVSNFERLSARSMAEAAPTMTVQTFRPRRTKLFLHGSGSRVVSDHDRLRLTGLLARGADAAALQQAAAEINAAASAKAEARDEVSRSCFTTVLTPDGRTTAQPHGISAGTQYLPSFALPQELLTPLGQAGLDLSSAQIVQMLSASVGGAEEHHYLNRLALYPGDTETLSNYAGWLQARNRLDEAEERHNQALASAPNNPHCIIAYAGFLAEVRKNYDKARRLFERAFELDPNNASVCLRYARFARYAQKNYPLAEDLYGRVLEYNRAAAFAVELAEFLLTSLEDLDKAETTIGRAFEWDPNYPPAFSARGYLHMKRGEFESARADLELALAGDPNDAKAAARLATVLHAAGTSWFGHPAFELPRRDARKRVSATASCARRLGLKP